MSIDLVVRYLHFISLFTMVSCLFAQFVLVKKTLQRAQIRLLGKLDTAYGISSILAVGAGLSLWFWLGKDASYYSENVIFWIKISLAGLLGVLSIYPTVFFIRNKNGDLEDEVHLPKAVTTLIRLELACVVVIPLLAVVMAHGVGL